MSNTHLLQQRTGAVVDTADERRPDPLPRGQSGVPDFLRRSGWGLYPNMPQTKRAQSRVKHPSGIRGARLLPRTGFFAGTTRAVWGLEGLLGLDLLPGGLVGRLAGSGDNLN